MNFEHICRIAFFIAILTLMLSAGWVISGCENVTPMNGAAQARDAAVIYLQEKVGEEFVIQSVPSKEWRLTGQIPDDRRYTYQHYASGNWTVEVYSPETASVAEAYEVTIISLPLARYWKGTVDNSGRVEEITAFTRITGETSRDLAEKFLRNSPTYLFDGIEATLTLVDSYHEHSLILRWRYTWEFYSRHPGYGDRSGEELSEKLTLHRVVITVRQYEIIRARVDGVWDMQEQDRVPRENAPDDAISVATFLGSPMYDTEVVLQGEVSKIGRLNCPCFDLYSEGSSIRVWYDLKVENDGTIRTGVDVKSMTNGDWAVVTGELKGPGGIHYEKDDFWASEIEILMDIFWAGGDTGE